MVAAFNPFSGADATFGPEAMAGCQAAATAINAAGGVLTDKVAVKNLVTGKQLTVAAGHSYLAAAKRKNGAKH